MVSQLESTVSKVLKKVFPWLLTLLMALHLISSTGMVINIDVRRLHSDVLDLTDFKVNVNFASVLDQVRVSLATREVGSNCWLLSIEEIIQVLPRVRQQLGFCTDYFQDLV